jgi:hypothetical protein
MVFLPVLRFEEDFLPNTFLISQGTWSSNTVEACRMELWPFLTILGTSMRARLIEKLNNAIKSERHQESAFTEEST